MSSSTSKTVLGIDAGTANTGLALLSDAEGVLDSLTLRTKPIEECGEWEGLIRRSMAIRDALVNYLDNSSVPVNMAAMEAYEDYGGGHLRMAKRRFYTPCTMAYIVQALEIAGVPVSFQRPSVVKRFKMYVPLIEGAKWLKNQHERDAALHAYYHLTIDQEL